MSASDSNGASKENGVGAVVKEPSKMTPHPAEASPKEDAKNRGWPKGKKRYPKSPGAPKQPLSGYVHFLNFRRDSVRKEFPEMSFAEISKKLAQEWSQLDAEEKQTYVKKAEEDKERYNREFSEYQRTDAYKQFVTMQKEKEKLAKNQAESTPSGSGNAGTSSTGSKKKKGSFKDNKEKSSSTSAMKMDEDTNPGSPSSGSFLDIPIFREDFLEHNKSREAELKQLRKQVIVQSWNDNFIHGPIPIKIINVFTNSYFSYYFNSLAW